jgi:CheY-like chemotaxis protein
VKFGPAARGGIGMGRSRVVSNRPSGPRVVLVDDSKTMLDVLKIHLMGLGFELFSSASAKDALAEVRQTLPDLVITDINMPDMTGLELARHLRASETTASIPIIIVSSKLTEDARAEAAELGVSICLTKPVRPNLLRAAVNQALSSR